MDTVETKFKGVEEILDELKAQAATGSCRSCQFCVPREYEEYGISHICAVQSNWDPKLFNESQLEREPYPCGPCEQGSWTETDDEGNRTQIPGCLAYKPRVIDGGSYWDAMAQRHDRFMQLLAEAARLHYAVKEGKLDRLLQELNSRD